MAVKPLRKCVFFDRDGIVNESPGPGRYVTRWSEFRLIDSFPDCLRTVRSMNYEAVLVTNQRGVALGLMSLADLRDIHRRMQHFLDREYKVRFLDIACCPHDRNQCSCRKPSPGMLLRMAKKHRLDLAGSWMIGDSATDIEAGRRAGCRTILVSRARVVDAQPDLRVSSMRVLARRIAGILK